MAALALPVRRRTPVLRRHRFLDAAASAVHQAAKPVTGRMDYPLLLAIAGLLAFGLIMVYSSSVVTAYTGYKNQFYFLIKQGISASIGLTVMLVLTRVDYHLLRALSVPGLVIAVFLLAAVLIPGVGSEVYGAQRWLPLG